MKVRTSVLTSVFSTFVVNSDYFLDEGALFKLLGIVVYITLYTVPLYKTRAHNYVVPDDVLTNGVAINWARTTDQISLYWFPTFKEVVVANWTIVDVNTPGNAWTNDHVPPTYDNFNILTNLLKEIIFGLTSDPCALANSLGMDNNNIEFIN